MNNQTPTAEELAGMLVSEATPDEKGWAIYRYLKENIGEKLPSAEARRLLLEYVKLQSRRPSLLHSLILGTAIKAAELYPDFRLPAFVEIWGLQNLRQEDFSRRQDDQGRTFHALAERLGVSLLRYLTAHAGEEVNDSLRRFALEQGEKIGYMPPMPMAAIKMFESEHDGRKRRMVRLVGADGSELTTDWRGFRAKPWEIVGRIYEVLPRRAEKSGNVRVDAIGQSPLTAGDVFGRVAGYVDSYDEKHKHYHIFDNTSRHFVAESPRVRISVGGYVWFAPVVPADDPFKSAIVLRAETKAAGREAFGAVDAKVEYVNAEKGYFSYTIAGTAGQERAYGKIKASERPLKAGDTVRLIIYQRRGMDGDKRPYVAEAF